MSKRRTDHGATSSTTGERDHIFRIAVVLLIVVSACSVEHASGEIQDTIQVVTICGWLRDESHGGDCLSAHGSSGIGLGENSTPEGLTLGGTGWTMRVWVNGVNKH